jgi:hypothetical protein
MDDLAGTDDARATARLSKDAEERMVDPLYLSEAGRAEFYAEMEEYLCFMAEKMEELGLGVKETQVEFRAAFRRFRREYLGGPSSAWYPRP